ncbi:MULTISPECIES: DUF4167 domain-containing protein [Acetobacter]|uniref:DUF4167 domain-containing protein n=1 Tax=Acetobacter thailandicus TaxID=1502842 RepID=A0ABT3QFU7_9PROT|nr:MULTISPECIES: DUF4167 domain-containing protein [Acetobacter]MBS0959581.1 DUF4167 domain-containing protein [Acetobacter thailandicus]MBS0979968.1 DUF4167 domain-containing protein [Acetobacter thailandicus]MBS0985263.1 DUF4167 domain-containing protein [Acetobacter thailandicus]MBS1002712.1 DUF4167 domain-containing protein [Acetobacter thailandicus]MCX2564131.1 DUF4167 domain-containing protein [Acetobacter thailandicus]
MNVKRMRTRNHRPGGGSGGGGGSGRHLNGQIPMNRNHVFDSHGPDVRVRGTAQQLFEKYLQHGRDATSSGDRVAAEAYFQHAEHFFRIMNAMAQAAQQSQQERAERQAARQQRMAASAEEDAEGGEVNRPIRGDEPQPDIQEQPELSDT